jgi:hypothetical protein
MRSDVAVIVNKRASVRRGKRGANAIPGTCVSLPCATQLGKTSASGRGVIRRRSLDWVVATGDAETCLLDSLEMSACVTGRDLRWSSARVAVGSVIGQDLFCSYARIR